MSRVLPRDLLEEVLSRVPMTSMRRVRSTCKKWNTLSTSQSFAKKHLGQARLAEAREFMVVMMIDFSVYLMRVNLHNNVESCIKREAKLISLDGSDRIDVSQVFHCDGLLLCITIDRTRLVVWNPYWGQTRWIETEHSFQSLNRYGYALGYEKTSKSLCRMHKILRFVELARPTFVEFKIYYFNSDSWRVLDVTPDCEILYYLRGVSLKGNTYWLAEETETREAGNIFLVCFDFTREIFGPLLPLPSKWIAPGDAFSLSSVRDEQLAVLFQCVHTLQMEIWVTTKIEPDAVSWNRKVSLAASIKQFIHPWWQLIPVTARSFFIDEEKKVAVVFDKDKEGTRYVAYIFGEDGSLKEADLGESPYKYYYPLVCSYVPSLVQLN